MHRFVRGGGRRTSRRRSNTARDGRLHVFAMPPARTASTRVPWPGASGFHGSRCSTTASSSSCRSWTATGTEHGVSTSSPWQTASFGTAGKRLPTGPRLNPPSPRSTALGTGSGRSRWARTRTIGWRSSRSTGRAGCTTPGSGRSAPTTTSAIGSSWTARIISPAWPWAGTRTAAWKRSMARVPRSTISGRSRRMTSGLTAQRRCRWTRRWGASVELSPANDPTGRLMIFGDADDGLLWHAWQNTANAGPWLGWLVI